MTMTLFEHTFAGNILGPAGNDNNSINHLCLDDIFRVPDNQQQPPQQETYGAVGLDGNDGGHGNANSKRVKRKRTSANRRSVKTTTCVQRTLAKSFKCDECNESFNILSNLNLHKTVHSEPPFYCGECHKVFGRCSSFLGHIKVHFQNELFICKLCGRTFAYYSLYEHHLRLAHHVRDVDIKAWADTPTGISNDSHASGIFERKLKNKSPREKKQQFECEDCSKLFSRSSSLRRHERIHRNERPYECTVCHQRFHQSGSLKTHQVIHNGQKPYLCEYCLRRFSQKGNLNLHIQRCHSMNDEKDRKRFSCMHCLCSFSKLNSLQTHMTKAHAITDSDRKRNDHDYEIHNEIKEVMKHLAEIQDAVLPAIDSHPTDVLDDHQYMDLNSFGSKSNFESSVNSSLNRNPFFDRSAEYVTLVDEDHQQNGKLVQRLVRQVFRDDVRWLVCKYCPKEFRRPSDLMRHFRVHTKERPFTCSMCPRTFSVRTTLNVHMRTHSNDLNRARKKFHRCPNCLQVFKNDISLNEHDCPKSNSNKQPRITDELKNFIDRNVPTDDLASFCDEIELNGREMIALNDICNEIIPEVPEHLADHASPSELKYFQCNLCPAIFKRKCHLNDHTVVHTGFKTHQCDICMKFYAKKSVLRRHKLIHQRKWPCKTCNSEFSNMEDLKEHSLLHLAELSSKDKPPISAELLLEDKHQAALADLQEIIASESHNQADLADLQETISSESEQFMGAAKNGMGDASLSVAQLPTLSSLAPLDDHNYNSTSAIILDENTGLFAVDSSSAVGVAVNDGDGGHLDSLNDHQYFLILDGNADNLIFSDLSDNIDLAHDSLDPAAATAFPAISNCDNELIELKPSIKGLQKNTDHLTGTSLDALTSSETWLMPAVKKDRVEIIDADTLAFWQDVRATGDGSLQFVQLESLTERDDELRIPNISVMKVSPQEMSNGMKDDAQKANGQETKRNHCQICDRTFKKPIDHRRHMRTHTGERPFKCEKCSRSFSLRCILMTHLKRHNEIKEKHICHVCQKVFAAKVSLNVHLRLHSGLKPFKCEYCDLRFRTSGHRIAHQQCHLRQAAKQHIEPKDVRTRKAKSKFKTIEDVVNKTLLEHNTKTKCETGSHTETKTVRIRKELKGGKEKQKAYIKSKTLFSCPSCPKTFKKRSLLLRHLVVHTQEKRFKCEICNNTFTQKSSLKTHFQRTHAAIKIENVS